MKTRELKKLVLVLFTVLLTGSTVFAQGWRGGNRAGYGRNLNWAADTMQLTCVNLIPGLTQDQKIQITDLESEHQKAMAKLRTERRSTFDAAEKNAIRIKMLERVQNHRDEVRNLLTDEQQKQYDLLQARNQAWQQGYRQGRRNAPRGAGFTAGNRLGRGGSAGCRRGQGGYGRGYNRW